jgi:superfamily II DNA or RNA helicase
MLYCNSPMRVDSVLTIGFDELTRNEQRKLEAALTFVNDQQEPVICYRKLMMRGCYVIPRGAWYLMPDDIDYYDFRSRPDLPMLDFTLNLDDVEKDERFAGQSRAIETMLQEEQGLIIRPPGTGKSAIGTAFAAQCGTRTLILVHTEDILQQWVKYIEDYIPELKGKVGVIRGKTCKIGHITVATVQTLNRSFLKRGAEWWSQWGCVIADEAHHVSAPTWEAVLNTCPAFYRFGFTASPTRADGMHPTMKFIVGPVIHRQQFTSPVKLEVVPVKTNFRTLYRGPFDWGPLLNALVSDVERNVEIAKLVDDEIAAGNTVLVLSRRIEHLEAISALLSGHHEILAAKTRTKKQRSEALQNFRDGNLPCILSTQLADEALDVPRLNRVFLIHPGKHEGRLIQQIGRAIRQHPEKEDAVIYDFIDHRVGVLRRQWSERKRAYKQNKISIRSSGVLSWT